MINIKHPSFQQNFGAIYSQSAELYTLEHMCVMGKSLITISDSSNFKMFAMWLEVKCDVVPVSGDNKPIWMQAEEREENKVITVAF